MTNWQLNTEDCIGLTLLNDAAAPADNAFEVGETGCWSFDPLAFQLSGKDFGLTDQICYMSAVEWKHF